ncbi:flavin monoamine oxidase family protein [Azorhizobium doebereinerae]|uniref:flavin monoamine oxidase family protein n=1 Tax=Azorhizobium doebereinerae TaxID=281091 RepID=UPI0003FE6003|nr:FAD-dependent oxidoreductase [Azorhizobium doebereinerae]
MTGTLTRRGLLAGAFALPAFSRALGQVPASGQVDVVIIGAGAAGIAAARKVAAAGRTYALIEAGKRVGGRAFTDTAAFGLPLDLGATRLFLPGGAPVVDLARQAGLDLYEAPRGARLYQGLKEASDSPYEDFAATVRRAERAIGAAGDAGRDLPAARVLPPDLGPFGAAASFMIGPLRCAKELDQVSTVDFSRAEERDEAVLCRTGIGSLVTKLAQGLTVRMETAASVIDLGPRNVEVRTSKGLLTARAVILAVPPSLIAAGKIRITPGLPTRQRSAVERITLGARDHIAFLLPGNPLNAAPDETLMVQTTGQRPFRLIARVNGSDVHVAQVGGQLAQGLADGGATSGADYVKSALQANFGADLARRMGKVVQTRWSREPLALGAISCALPGSGNMRRAFTEVVANRLVFAGEHAHETLWGTVPGAWLSGERAAGQALRILGVQGASLAP